MRKKIIGIIGFVAGIALIFAIVAPHVRPNDRDIIVLFGLLFPYLYLLALIIWPFTWRKNKITFVFLAILLLWSTIDFISYVKPSLSFAPRDVAADLHVLSFNAMMGTRLVNSKHVLSKERQRLFDELMHRNHPPDVICAQEVNFIVDEALLKSFGYEYYHRLEERGAVILSKYPMIKKGNVDFGKKLNSCLWADILVPVGDGQDTIRIYSTHFESNRLSEESYEFLAKEGYEGAEAIAGIRDLITKYPKYASMRGDQAHMVKSHIKKSPHPVILAGDFNDPPMSYTYEIFKDDLCDSFVEKGRGWGTTWIGAIPMLRIDFIFSSPELKVVDFQCLRSNLSDHYPVKASYQIPVE